MVASPVSSSLYFHCFAAIIQGNTALVKHNARLAVSGYGLPLGGKCHILVFPPYL